MYLKNGISVLVDRCIDDPKPRLELKKLSKKYGTEFQEIILYIKTLNCAVERVRNRPMKSLSKFKKTKINRPLISSLRKIVMKEADQKDVLSFDTERESVQKVVQEIAKYFFKV